MRKLPYTKRRNSWYIQSVPLTLTAKIKHPAVLPKIHTFSKNYDENCIVEQETSFQNDDGSNHVGFQSKIFNEEPVIDNEIPNLFCLKLNKHTLKKEINISPLPKLCPQIHPSFDKMFRDKIKMCNYIFDFTQPRIQVNGKREKCVALVEISTLLSKDTEAILLSTEHQDLLLQMVIRNIFDQHPFTTNKKINLSMLTLNYVESSWEQLSIAFKILNQFVLLFPEKVDISLCRKAIYLMNIPDINERECFVTFLKNYEKTHQQQIESIWNFLISALINVRYDIYTPFCVDPIISFMTILFFESLSSHHEYYFTKILHTHILPLFDREELSVYYIKLSNFVIQIIDNDTDEQLNVILFLIHHFPYRCGNKQPLFVSTINTIIEMIHWERLNSIAEKLFIFIAMAVKSPNKKLAESALLLLMKANMKHIITSSYKIAMDVLYEPLKWSSAFYWNKFVKDQSSTCLSSLISANLEFQHNKSLSDFLLCSDLPTAQSEHLFNGKKSVKRDSKELLSIWASISRMAAKFDRSIDLTKSLYKIQIEFKNGHVTMNTNSPSNVNQTAVPSMSKSGPVLMPQKDRLCISSSCSKGKEDNVIKLNSRIRNFRSNFT